MSEDGKTHWTKGLDGSSLVEQYGNVFQHVGIGGMTGMPSCTPVPASPLLCPREAVLPALSGRAGPQEEPEPASRSAGLQECCLQPRPAMVHSVEVAKWIGVLL